MRYLMLPFKDLGIDPQAFNGKTHQEAYIEIVQISCDYIMDQYFPEYSEHKIIASYSDIGVDWTAEQVVVPVKTPYTTH